MDKDLELIDLGDAKEETKGLFQPEDEEDTVGLIYREHPGP